MDPDQLAKIASEATLLNELHSLGGAM